MVSVYRNQVVESRPFTFETEASDLSWAPGNFPETVETDLGNKMTLVRVKLNSAGATYEQTAGCVKVIVWND